MASQAVTLYLSVSQVDTVHLHCSLMAVGVVVMLILEPNWSIEFFSALIMRHMDSNIIFLVAPL